MEVSYQHIHIRSKAKHRDNYSETTKESYKQSKKIKKLKKHIKSKHTLSKHFKFISTKNLFPPKKDYLRCKVIRSHKRALRQVSSHSSPIKMILFNKDNTLASLLWQRFTQIYFENQPILQKISQADLNRMPDRKKIWKNHESAVKSFNSKFCKSYFSEEAVRESYYYFIELMFYDSSPEVLKKKFEFTCCLQGSHNEACAAAWAELKKYLQTEVLVDLNTSPWVPAVTCPNESVKVLKVSHSQPEWVNKIYIKKYFKKYKES